MIDVATTTRRTGGFPKGSGQHGGMPTKYHWTPALDAILVARYDGHRDTIDALMPLFPPDFPRYAVKKRARDLGLARGKEPNWSEADEAWLAEHLATTSWKACAAHLGRSMCAVKLKAKRIEASKGTRGQDGSLTGRGAGLLCGVDAHRVAEWVAAGQLVGIGRGIERPQGDVLRIMPQDLRSFILEHPEAIDLRRVEGSGYKTEFLQLLAGDGRQVDQVSKASNQVDDSKAQACESSPPASPQPAAVLAPQVDQVVEQAAEVVQAPTVPGPGSAIDFRAFVAGLRDFCNEALGIVAPTTAPAPAIEAAAVQTIARVVPVQTPATASEVARLLAIPGPAAAPKLPAAKPAEAASICIGHADHECAAIVPRKNSRCRSCKSAHKAEYMAAYWQRPGNVEKYGAKRNPKKSEPAAAVPSGDVVQPGVTDVTDVTSRDAVQRRETPAALMAPAPPPIQVAAPVVRTTPSAKPAATPTAPRAPAAPPPTTAPRVSPRPAPKPAAKPKGTAHDRAARFAEAQAAAEPVELPAPRPRVERPPVPEEGLTLGDIHRRTGLPFSTLKWHVEIGKLKVMNPDERPPRYTPESLADVERSYKLKGRSPA